MDVKFDIERLLQTLDFPTRLQGSDVEGKVTELDRACDENKQGI